MAAVSTCSYPILHTDDMIAKPQTRIRRHYECKKCLDYAKQGYIAKEYQEKHRKEVHDPVFRWVCKVNGCCQCFNARGTRNRHSENQRLWHNGNRPPVSPKDSSSEKFSDSDPSPPQTPCCWVQYKEPTIRAPAGKSVTGLGEIKISNTLPMTFQLDEKTMNKLVYTFMQFQQQVLKPTALVN